MGGEIGPSSWLFMGLSAPSQFQYDATTEFSLSVKCCGP